MTDNARIFINYRRSDSAGWARQLHGDLAARFGAERVFRDVAIEPGVDFVEHIERVMDSCEVCIIVIGPGWTEATTADGNRRLDDPADLVRREIQRALERPDVQVIPALVDGARMPAEHELPEGLRPLARRNAVELTDSRWNYDVEVLCQRLRSVLGESTVKHEQRPAPVLKPNRESTTQPSSAILLAVVATIAAAACAAIVAAVLSQPLAGQGDRGWGRLAAYAIERGVIWAIVGALVVAVAAAAFGGVRVPLGQAFVGAGTGWLGGAAGGAGYIAIKHFGGVTEQDAQWLLLIVSIALPGVPLAMVLARAAGARAGECALAALAGAVLAVLLSGGDRTVMVTLQVVLVVGATVAVLAATPHPALGQRRALGSRGTAGT